MIKYKILRLLLFFVIIISISASTHWIVTENGRIQPQLDSPFYMRRPYDLLSFLEQEERRTQIDTLYQNLVDRKVYIDEKWSGLEGATDIESRLYSQDSDCLKAGKLLSEIDLYASIALDGSDRDGITFSDFLVDESLPDASIVPECHKIMRLDFSMFTFEHLVAMVNRANLSMSPEHALVKWLKTGTTVASFGHQIAVGLSKNTTSWFHYNLGAIYWRMRGDAFRAVECGRRAVYFAPREYRDVALLNLASIFQQSRSPGEAAILLHAAVDHAPHQALNHLALANVYAILADYNRSIACLDNCLKLKPGLAQAVTTRHALLCHTKLEAGLVDLHQILQGILSELHDYHSQREQWILLHEKLLKEQAPLEAKLLGISSDTISAVLANRAERGQTCAERWGDSSRLSCQPNTDSQTLANSLQVQVDIALSLQVLLKNVESQAQKISEQMARNTKLLSSDGTNLPHLTSTNTKDEKLEPSVPVDQPRYPPTMLLSWDNIEFDNKNWPSAEQCASWKLTNIKAKKIEVLLPPENKGFHISRILSSEIDLPLDAEHSLPWYPPLCEVDSTIEPQLDTTYFSPIFLKQTMQSGSSSEQPDPFIRDHLLQYVPNGATEQAEIGQRILTAMKKKVAPDWLLATLSSIYWRARSNRRNALDCLKVVFVKVPKEYRDVPLVSLASIMFEIGFIDEALRAVVEAFTINKVEPATNFLLALLHNAKDNNFGAVYHMKQVLRVDPGYRNGEAEQLLKSWACSSKIPSLDESISDNKEQMCSEQDQVSEGGGVVCSTRGTQCKTAAIQCYRAERIVEDGDLMTFDAVPISGLLDSTGEGSSCSESKKGLQSLYSSLVAAYSREDTNEPDQSQLESMDDIHRAIHMRMALDEERDDKVATNNPMGDFYVSLSEEPSPKVLLHVYDKSGTYQLSPATCKDIKDADWLSFTSMWWHSVAARNIDIGPLLKPLPAYLNEPILPICDKSSPMSLPVAEHIPYMSDQKFIHAPEPRLSDWLALMTGDPKSSVRDLGTRIALALRENSTSWMLATAAAIYWRVLGNTAQAIICLKHALHVAPDNDKDIPMINLANVLQRIGFLGDALEVAKMGLEIHPDYVVNQFTIGNIYTALGDFEKAISFYRTSLTLDPKFEAARNRLQAILCTLLFDETGSLRDSSNLGQKP